MIGTMVLAAGDGRRMGGGGKALLEVGGVSFLERVIRTSRDGGCERVWVLTQQDQEGAREMAASLGGKVVINTAPQRGMFSSVVEGVTTALAENRDVKGFLIFPVDHPRVRAETIQTLIRTLPGLPRDRFVHPVHKGRGGHPILVSRAGAEALAALDPTAVFRDALKEAALLPHPVEVPDPHIRENLNTPSDLG